MSTLLELQHLSKTYQPGRPNEVQVLHDLQLRMARGEFAALMGPSGSGKSTLLNILGLLETPTEGDYVLQGASTRAWDEAERAHARQSTLGFVFQFHHLLPAFTALENVTLPVLARDGRIGPAMKQRAQDLLAAVGLQSALHRKPAELSGGMQQRTAIARALILSPALVLADEPTGNLDSRSADEVFALMRQLHVQEGTSFLIVTHDARLGARCDRRIELVDGRLVSA